MDKHLNVYIDLTNRPILVGRLWARDRGGRESASFQYDQDWLSSRLRFPLEPALTLDPGAHHTQLGKKLFGSIGDSAPDRWGRVLMRRQERRLAEREQRAIRALNEIDYLLSVDDFTRQGSLRFKDVTGGDFLADSSVCVPPLIELPRLLSAAGRVATDDESDEDLRLLLAPGSSLGGARPKASVIDRDGQLTIAKFPHRDDEYQVEIWSYVLNCLAGLAGIVAPVCRLVEVGDRRIQLVRRFDREKKVRIPFLSAMSMIGGSDGETRSYLEIVDAIRQYSASPNEDLAELWRRVLFSILVSNFDDHMRNHGFLYDSLRMGWRLSPVYDLNPVPLDVRPRVLSSMIDDASNAASFSLLLDTADYYGLDSKMTKQIVREVLAAVPGWRRLAKAQGIEAREIERMTSAFEHSDLEDAKRYVN